MADGSNSTLENKIEALNAILALEYAAFHQYTQQSFLVHGLDRHDFYDYFEDQAENSYEHAKMIGNKIVAYGGLPVIEAAAVSQSTDILVMLKDALEMERKLRDAYIAAIPLAEADNDVPLKFLLEQQAYNEQQDVDEIEKYLSQKLIGVGQIDNSNSASRVG